MSARENLFGFVEAGAEEEDLPAFAAAIDAFRAEVLAEAEAKVRSAAASWSGIQCESNPDHFKVIAAHALLIANDLRAMAAAPVVPVPDTTGDEGAEKTYPPSSFGAVIYEALDSFQRANRLPGLQHAQIRGHLTEHLVAAFAADAAKLLAELDEHCPAEYGGPGYTHCELTAGHDGRHESALGNMRRATWGGAS